MYMQPHLEELHNVFAIPFGGTAQCMCNPICILIKKENVTRLANGVRCWVKHRIHHVNNLRIVCKVHTMAPHNVPTYIPLRNMQY